MLKFILLPLAMGATVTVAAAQALDSTTIYKHHLGLTASPVLSGFFKNNRSLPLGLLYKRQIKPTQFVRLRLVGQYSSRDTTDYWQSLPGSNNRYWALHGYVGYEWQQAVSRRVRFYYGAELGGGCSRRSFRDVRSGVESDGSFQYDALRVSKQWQVEGRPFVGVQVAVSQRFSFFIESAVSVAYARYRQNYNGAGTFTYNNGGPTVPTGVSAFYTSDSWQMRWRPVQLIGLQIKF